jgi:hypothetical protein
MIDCGQHFAAGRNRVTYNQLEIGLCAMVVVAVGTISFLLAVSLVALAKGAIMFARLLRKAWREAPATFPGLLRAWRSSERVRVGSASSASVELIR